MNEHCTTVSDNKCNTKQEKECSILQEEQYDKDSHRQFETTAR